MGFALSNDGPLDENLNIRAPIVFCYPVSALKYVAA
jgi:hypothetical protein